MYRPLNPLAPSRGESSPGPFSSVAIDQWGAADNRASILLL